MSFSIREQILRGIVQTLTTAAPGNASVARSYKQLITRSQVPTIVVTPAEELTKPQADNVDNNDLVVDVEIAVRGDPYDLLIDTVAVPAHAALMTWAASSPLFSFFRRIASTWQAQEADLTAGMLTMKYRVVYLCDANDISKPGAPG